ncbi:putative serine/threonine-protein kinase YbdM [Sporomusa silvacetica DSM 10669]|uniref:non-specific serine/threonine protein kinase n=1 Tax=Sporomusa silvacetica DSM 10669 TaxID=1123289 RepID=A0ABZ3IM08_9FIRM|nr:serine/threonine-protein kinase B [Sporomusa silvacetica DSM 10669]
MVRVYKEDRCYAMKVYYDQYLTQKGHASGLTEYLFQREKSILLSIKFSTIPGYVDSFVCDNMYCLIQEFLPGNTLAALINQGQRFCETEVRQLLSGLLEILNYLHIPGAEKPVIVHRDLRLSNIIVNDERLFLIDFGLAYRLQNSADIDFLTECASRKITADSSSSYMKKRNDFSIQSDLFGAGVVAVDLFTNSISFDQSVSWEQHIPVSPSLKSFIRRLLAVDGKFASCNEALEHLRWLK